MGIARADERNFIWNSFCNDDDRVTRRSNSFSRARVTSCRTWARSICFLLLGVYCFSFCCWLCFVSFLVVVVVVVVFVVFHTYTKIQVNFLLSLSTICSLVGLVYTRICFCRRCCFCFTFMYIYIRSFYIVIVCFTRIYY